MVANDVEQLGDKGNGAELVVAKLFRQEVNVPTSGIDIDVAVGEALVAVVGHLEAVTLEEFDHLRGVGIRNTGVETVVDQTDVLAGAWNPARREVFALKGLHELKGLLALHVENDGGYPFGDVFGGKTGLHGIARVVFAEQVFADVAQRGLLEDVAGRDAQTVVFVVGEQRADDGGGHGGLTGADELAIGLADVVGTAAGNGMGETDVGVSLGTEPQHADGGLTALGVTEVEEEVAPLVAHVAEQLAGGKQTVDAGLGIGAGYAVGLIAVGGGPKAVVVGSHGNEPTAHHFEQDVDIAPRRALVFMVNGVMVVEHHATGLPALLLHLVAEDDGARLGDGVAVGIGARELDVIDGGTCIGLVDGLGDAGWRQGLHWCFPLHRLLGYRGIVGRGAGGK